MTPHKRLGIKTIANWPTEAELLKQARANAARLHRLAQPALLSEHAAFFEQLISVPGLDDTSTTSPAAEDNRPMRSTEPKPPETS